MRQSGQLVVILMTLIAAPPLLGQGSGRWLGIVEAGYSNDGSNDGLGLSVGGARASHQFRLGASLETIFGTKLSDRYFEDAFSSSQDRCRDGKTGQFVSGRKCNTVQRTYAGFVVLEGTVSRTFPLIVGGGYRLGANSQPVAVVGLTGATEHVAANAQWRLTAVLGNAYVSVRAGVTVPQGSAR